MNNDSINIIWYDISIDALSPQRTSHFRETAKHWGTLRGLFAFLEAARLAYFQSQTFVAST